MQKWSLLRVSVASRLTIPSLILFCYMLQSQKLQIILLRKFTRSSIFSRIDTESVKFTWQKYYLARKTPTFATVNIYPSKVLGPSRF